MTRFLARQPGLFRSSGLSGTLRLGAGAVYGFEDPVGMDPMKTVRYERILARINGKYNAVITPPLSRADSAWLDFLNLKFMATSPNVRLDPAHWRLAYEGIDGRVFENRRVLPRYFWAKQVISADTNQEAFEKANANPADLGEKVVLEPDDVDQKAFEKANANPADSGGKGGPGIRREKPPRTGQGMGKSSARARISGGPTGLR